MKIKKLLAVVLCILMLVSLCACGKMTVERLVADMAKALADTNSFAGTMNMGMEISLSILGQSMDISMTMDTEVSFHDNVNYSKGIMTTTMTGLDDEVVETEGYTVMEGDTFTTYSLSDGKWTKMEMQKPEIKTSLDTIKMLIDPENIGKIVLQEELDTYNGKEVYVLTISDCNYPELASEYVNSQFGDLFGDVEMSEIDLSGIVMQVTLKVYKDTKLPAVLTVDFGDSMTTVMDSVMDAMMGALSGEIEGFDISGIFEQIEMNVDVPAMMTTITFDEYNIDPIVVPKEALAAEPILEEGASIFDSIFGSTMGDMGSLEGITGADDISTIVPGIEIIYSDDGLSTIALDEPSGYTFLPEYSDYYSVSYEHSTYTEYVSYVYYILPMNGDTAEKVVEDSIGGYVEYLDTFDCEDLVISDVQTAIVCGYEVTYVTFDYFLDYPSQDVIALVQITEDYALIFETYTITDGEIDTMVTLETGVAAIVG